MKKISNLAYAMMYHTSYSKKGQYKKEKDVRRQKSDDGTWEEEKRCMKTKETMQK